jgi:signal transduction histidine kinase
VLMFLGLAQARLAFALAAFFGPTWIVLSGVLRLLAVLLAAVGLHQEAQRELVRSQLLAQRLLREQLQRASADEEQRHDVRAAVFAIQGTASALETHHDALEPNAVAALARALASEAARLERMVSGAGRQAVAPFDVAAVLEPLIAFERARGQRVTVSGFAGSVVACGRPDEVGEIVRNLLDNARLHAPGAAVSVSVRRADGHVLVTVADAGPGVPVSARSRIFERGERADTSVDGSGLGLYVAAKLAREQSADLWLEEPDGAAGAAFTLCLPVPSPAPMAIRPRLAGPTEDMAVAT